MRNETTRRPAAWVSAIPLGVLTLLLWAVIRTFGGGAIDGGSQIALLSAASVCVMLAIGIYRCRWAVLEDAIVDNIRASASAIIILLLIGAIAGTWMVSGVVPTMIYYGLHILHPSFFLVASCVICGGVSLMTGSSWTTIATIGVALMGIGRAMGFPEGWIAGAIISGAYFGDKLSLLSDTTVLASSTVGAGLFFNLCTADQYISIILSGRLFRDLYAERGLEKRLLSRSVEDSATVCSVLVPWNSCGMTQATVLGVSTFVYMPYCIFNIVSPLMSLLVAAAGWKIRRAVCAGGRKL